MANQKISQLPSGTNAQAGDLFVIARGGANLALTTAQLFNAPSAAATFASLAVSGNVTLNSSSGSVGINATPSITHQLIVKGTTTDSSRNAFIIRDSADAAIAAFRNDKRADFYGDAAIVGNLAVDTNTLFVDAVNNRVGVGTASPGYPLDISGTGKASSAFWVGDASGNVSGGIINESDTSKSVTFNADPANVGASSFMRFNVDGIERARITSGSFSVGTTTDLGAGNIAIAAGKYLGFSSTAYITPENNIDGAEVSTSGVFTVKTGSGPTERVRVKTTGQTRFVPLSADPAGAENGDVYYNSSTNKLRVYAGGAWTDLH